MINGPAEASVGDRDGIARIFAAGTVDDVRVRKVRPMTTTLGERIRELRDGWMTQQDLATASNVSLALIRKLEQGQRHTASIPYLQRIARALDVEAADLLGRERPVSAGDGSHASIAAVRDALTSVGDLLGELDDADAPDLSELARSLTYSWGLYWSGRYGLLVELLPRLLTEAKAALHQAPIGHREHAADLVAQTKQIAAGVLLRLGAQDLAYTAARESLTDSRTSGDVLREGAMLHTLAHVLIRQGRYDEAVRLTVSSAQNLDLDGNAAPQQLSVYGGLLLRGASAASRAGRHPEALDLLTEARSAATRVGTDRTDYEVLFGLSQVTVQTADAHVLAEDYSAALSAAKGMPRASSIPPLSRARHLADVAYSHVRLGQADRAVDTLLTMERVAPDVMRYQVLPRQVTRELLSRGQRKSARLRALAERIGVTRSA